MKTPLLSLVLGSVPPLPAPPALPLYFLESPLLVAGGLGAIGALLIVIGGRRGAMKSLGAVGVAVVLIGAAVFGVATLVRTEREVILARTAELVRAVAESDVPATEALLADEVRIRISGASVPTLGRDTLLGIVRSFDAELALEEWSVGRRDAIIDIPGRARSRVNVRVTPEQTRLPAGSLWALDWGQEAGGAWVITAVEPLLINGRRPGVWLAGELTRYAR